MNKKVIVQLSAALMLTGLVACSSSSETTKIDPVALEQDPNLCYFDSTKMRAPDWICGTPVEGYPVAAVGSFRDTKAGTSFARNQATMDGRVQLATEMKAKVGAMVKNHAETTGVGDQETVDAVASVTQRQITAEILFGAKAINYRRAGWDDLRLSGNGSSASCQCCQTGFGKQLQKQAGRVAALPWRESPKRIGRRNGQDD